MAPVLAASAAAGAPAATERGDLTRRRILDVAAAAFAKAGYAGTSLNDLIREAGLTKGGFYFHFPSKQALALAVIEDKQENWLRQVSTAVLRKTRGIDQLRTMNDSLCDLLEQDPSFGSIGKLCREMGAEADLGPQVAQLSLGTWIQMVSAVVRRGQQEGDVRPDVDPDGVGQAAVAAVLGIKDLSDMASGGRDVRARMNTFAEIFLNGILSPSARGLRPDQADHDHTIETDTVRVVPGRRH